MEILDNAWINCVLDPVGRCLRNIFVFFMVHFSFPSLLDELNIITLGIARVFELNPKYFNYVTF